MRWYAENKEKVLSELNSFEMGLSKAEVKNRLEKYGKNELPKLKKDSVIKMFFTQLLDPIVLLLLATVVFSFIIGEVIDAVAIIFIILIDLLIGTYQEWKASKTAESLSNLIKVKVIVLRDGREEEIDSSQLVIGDIILLSSGDKISADARILECHNLTVDESALTGESIDIEKKDTILNEKCELSSRVNMVFAGTNVITGRAKCAVVETAINTEIGKIADKVTKTKEAKSPLTIRMEKFSKQITTLIVIIAIIIACLMFYKGESGHAIFLSVIALSVSAMPEGLPLALTMALTIGSNRMSKKNVVVKKLNAVESLGSCTVIASDKTGTLTVNEQTAKKIVLPNGQEFNIEGTGYNDNGKIICQEGYNYNYALEIAKMGCINNESILELKNNKWQSMGDSIDIAFLALSKKAKVNKDDCKILETIPYESENKYSAVFYEYNDECYCTVKGSIEKVISFCKTEKLDNIVPINEQKLLNQNEILAKDGYRVIALAQAKIQKQETYSEKNIQDLTFLGLVAFIDPIREEAKQSIIECKEAGIKVMMITGDHPLTAFSIAKDLGLVQNMDEVTTGTDVTMALEKGEQYFDEFVKNKIVFTRVTPLDKLEIVNSLKRQGEFVAVTGDGVNDAPAIKVANIGVAMGSGTDVAKETSDMIIIDDNFKSIVAGIKEGRNAYSNIRKICYMLLSCGLAEVLFFLLSIAFDLPMPLVAIQLLWLNIVTDGLQDMALSFEKPEVGIMKESPRSTKESMFNKELFAEVALAGLVMGLIVFLVWINLLKNGMEVAHARGYIMMLMVFMQNIHVLNCRSEKKSTFKISIKSNLFIILSITSAILLQIIMMEVDIFSAFLQTYPMPWLEIVKLFFFSLIILLVMELYKWLRYRKNK